MSKSTWCRICIFCGGLLDTRGSCQQCTEEGRQPGHTYCYGKQNETGYRQVFAEPDQFERCRCPHGQATRDLYLSRGVIQAAQFACSPEGHKPKSGAMGVLKQAVAAYNEEVKHMTTLNDFENETWTDEDGNTVEQIVGHSGVYLVVTDKDGNVIRDDRPWQMREGLS